jgi:hypothetical protein
MASLLVPNKDDTIPFHSTQNQTQVQNYANFDTARDFQIYNFPVSRNKDTIRLPVVGTLKL